MMSDEKEFLWREERRGKITSSILPDLNTKGRGGDMFGLKALTALYAIRYERRTGITRESLSNRNFDWGHEMEYSAIEWIRTQLLGEVRSCSEDFDKIVFNKPFDGFGDSPDFYVYAHDGVTVEAIGEIKCPISQGKIEELQFLNIIDSRNEYYEQFLGHFIGRPDVDTLYYVIYDGYADTGKIIEMNRKDFLTDIEQMTAKIILANDLINRSIELDLDFKDLIKN